MVSSDTSAPSLVKCSETRDSRVSKSPLIIFVILVDLLIIFVALNVCGQPIVKSCRCRRLSGRKLGHDESDRRLAIRCTMNGRLCMRLYGNRVKELVECVERQVAKALSNGHRVPGVQMAWNFRSRRCP